MENVPKVGSIPPLDHGASRQVWIGWGVGLMSVPLGYLVGGNFWPFLFLAAGIVAVLRGYFPQWFSVQTQAQLITGTAARVYPSKLAWFIASCGGVALAVGMSLLYRTLVPAKPDISKVVHDAVTEAVAAVLSKHQPTPDPDVPPATQVGALVSEPLPKKPIAATTTAPVIIIEPHYGRLRGAIDHKFKFILDNIGLTDISHIEIYEYYFLLVHINPLEFQNAASFGDAPDSEIPFLANKHSVPFEIQEE